MAIEPQYRELFSESVTLFPSVSVDKYGKRAYTASASVVVPAHLVSETILTRDETGREVIETGRIYLNGYFPNIDSDYRIVLQSGASPVVIGVDTPFDNVGGHHTVVRLGRRTGS